MHVIQVDVVALQAAQAGLDRVHQVVARGAPVVGAVAGGEVKFGSQHKFIPATFEGLAQGLLRAAALVGVGRVEVIDAHLEGGVNHVVDLFLGQLLRAKAIGAQPNHRDFYPGFAKLSVFHEVLLKIV